MDGAFQVTSGKLPDAILGGTPSNQTREDLQAVKVLQDLFGEPVVLLTTEKELAPRLTVRLGPNCPRSTVNIEAHIPEYLQAVILSN